MARIHGKNSTYSFNGVDLSDELNSITQTATVGAADVTAFADTYGVALAGKKSVSTDIAGAWDPAAAAGDITIFDAISGGTVTTIFDPSGSGPDANNPEYTCTSSGLTGALVASYRLSCPVGEKASYTATIQHSGSTTRAVA